MAKRILKLYRGFGHTHDMVLFGHVLEGPLKSTAYANRGSFANLLRLLGLFMVKPVGGVAVKLVWEGQTVNTLSEKDGFFWCEWQAAKEADAGIHHAPVVLSDDSSNNSLTQGEIIIPHRTQYAFISDIDDTIMVSHSATVFKRMKELFFKGPGQRTMFKDVATHYRLLALSHTSPQEPNPFFYVSSSEWNLYDYLVSFFAANQLPHGAFLLSQVKKWYQLFKTGKTKHSGKLLRIVRLFVLFPNQKFVLFGDNSQSDPFIYETLTQKYAERIAAVYIRNVVPAHEAAAGDALKKIETKNIPVLQFTHSVEAIAHSRAIGLINVQDGQ